MEKAFSDIQEVVVHDGTFHCDDVSVVALIQMLNPKVIVKRLNRQQLPQEKAGILIADIGYGKYDHHQSDAAVDANGHKYASVGLVLKDFHNRIYPEGIPDELEKIIRDIEDIDNGINVPDDRMGYYVTCAVDSFLPEWNEPQSSSILDVRFYEAVDFIKENLFYPYKKAKKLPVDAKNAVLKRYKYYLQQKDKAKNIAKELIKIAYDESDYNIIILPQLMPWEEYLADTDALYVIYPSNRGGYNLQCVPNSGDLFSQKLPLPEKWLLNPPAGCTFVHSARFLAAFETKDLAYNAARELITEQ